MTAQVVDLLPQRARLLAYAGDPFSFRIEVVDEDGDPSVDVSGWEWRATVTTGNQRLDFECEGDETGVDVWMRGEDTARLPTSGREFPFDVTGRQPAAGEGTTVLRGEMTATRRVTIPLRSDPEAEPADAEPAMA